MVGAAIIVGNGVNISCWFCVVRVVAGSGSDSGSGGGQVMNECGCHGME
jgi:hypothetical protein